MLKNNNLLIIGAGQYGVLAMEIAEAMGAFGRICFLDDSYKPAGHSSADFATHSSADGTLVGTTKDMEKFAGEFGYGFVAIGNPDVRRRLSEQLEMNGFTLATLVHPRAFVSPSAQIHKGCCIEPMATVQTEAVLSAGTFVASGAVIRHNAFVGEFCHVDCNAVVETLVNVTPGTKVLCNSVFRREQG